MKLALASGFTLGLLASFLFAVLGGLAFFIGAANFYVVLAAVILINFLMWLVSPKISDFTYSWFYDMRWIDIEELREISPESAEVIERVTDEYDYSTPKLGIIHDSNPQAFTYGSGRWNSRIMVTEGLFEYLDDKEASSVYAHELGHITNRDFIIMTVANTIVQLLYLIAIRLYRAALRSDDGRQGMALGGFAVISFVFYYLGRYLVYYLSRVREYYADKFAGKHTHPDYLSSALIKISYGVMASPDNEDLMKATESMGVMNIEQAEEKGALYHNMSGLESWEPLAKAFLFDIKNPWASLLELKSTHPLTGKRVKALSGDAENPMFDFEELKKKFEVDTARLYKNFFRDLAVLAVPTALIFAVPAAYLYGVATNSIPANHGAALGVWIAVLGIGRIGKNVYQYPLNGEFEQTTVMELLSDIYASPVKGSRAMLDGKIIGRGRAGYMFGKDLMFKDETGIMHMRYQSIIPVIGNFLFGWRKAEKFVDSQVNIKGWFKRGTMPWMEMRQLNDQNSWPHLYPLITGGIIATVGLIITLATIL